MIRKINFGSICCLFSVTVALSAIAQTKLTNAIQAEPIPKSQSEVARYCKMNRLKRTLRAMRGPHYKAVDLSEGFNSIARNDVRGLDDFIGRTLDHTTDPFNLQVSGSSTAKARLIKEMFRKPGQAADGILGFDYMPSTQLPAKIQTLDDFKAFLKTAQPSKNVVKMKVGSGGYTMPAPLYRWMASRGANIICATVDKSVVDSDIGDV